MVNGICNKYLSFWSRGGLFLPWMSGMLPVEKGCNHTSGNGWRADKSLNQPGVCCLYSSIMEHFFFLFSWPAVEHFKWSAYIYLYILDGAIFGLVGHEKSPWLRSNYLLGCSLKYSLSWHKLYGINQMHFTYMQVKWYYFYVKHGILAVLQVGDLMI